MAVMYAASGPVSAFIAEHPTTKMLALAFLVLIGVALVADGFEFHIPRGYIYFAMAFAAAVEAFNVHGRPQPRRARRRKPRSLMPVLLITGAGRGIGAATAKLAAARGYDVGVNYKSDAESAAAVVDAVKAQGRKAVAIQADMASRSRRRAHVQEADDKLGPLTHFVYNAGIPGTRRPARGARARDDARGDRRQRAGRAVVAAARDPAHVEEARRAGRLDRAAVVGRGRHRRAQRICLVRRLQGRDRVDDLRAEQGARRRRHPRQLRVAGRERDPHPRRRRHAGKARRRSRR